MRHRTDPVADRAAEALFQSHNIRGVTKFLDFLARNDSSVEVPLDGFSLPQGLKDYFNDLSHFQFTEKEKELFDRVSDTFELFGPLIAANLAVRSLLKQYAATKATNVLRITTLLTDFTDRRVTETFQFVLDVMQKGWYLPTGRGIRSIQKLRLIHALIRHRIKHGMTSETQGKWDMAWGEPINQEDMIFANQTFSCEVLEGLQQVGIELSEEQREDYFSAWVLIGKALGVDPSLEASNFAEGAALQQQIYDRQFTLPNHNAPPLAKALVKWLDNVIPFDVSEKSILTIVKYFNSPKEYHILEDNLQLGSLMGLNDNLPQHLHHEIGMVHRDEFNHVQGAAPLTDADFAAGNYPFHVGLKIIELFANKLLRGAFAHKRGSKSTSFQIDDALAEKWGLPGNEGIPKPDMPPFEPKKRHPLIQFFYDLGVWVMGLVVKVREWFQGKK